MQQQKPQPSLLQALDAGLVVQLQALTAQLTAAATANSLNPLEQRVSSFNKVMLESAATGLSFLASSDASKCDYLYLLQKLLGPFDFGNDSERGEESKKDSSSSQLWVEQVFIIRVTVHSTWVFVSNQAVDHFQAHGVRAHKQLLIPPVGWAPTTAEPGAVSKAAVGAPAAPAEGT